MQHLYSAIHRCFDMQTIKRVDGSVLTEKSVYAKSPEATSGFCLVLNERFDVEKQGNIWIERSDTSRPIHGTGPGRPKERQGRYVHTAIDIREDLLNKLDQERGNKSRREYIEQLLEQ